MGAPRFLVVWPDTADVRALLDKEMSACLRPRRVQCVYNGANALAVEVSKKQPDRVVQARVDNFKCALDFICGKMVCVSSLPDTAA